LGGIVGEPSLMADQVHPNAKGYEVMATKIEAAIRPVLFEKVEHN
jgi:lysophospholipase L1-like esterase